MPSAPKPASDSVSEMVQVVLPNDANPLGYILGGTVMHLVDIAGAIAALRHTRTRVVTAAVDGLQFLHPIKVGDLIILRSRVTCTFGTSLEVAVDVLSEETLTGVRQLTSHAFLTFVSVDGVRQPPARAAAPHRNGCRPPAMRGGSRETGAAVAEEEGWRGHLAMWSRDFSPGSIAISRTIRRH